MSENDFLMESILVYSVLLKADMVSMAEYNEFLDKQFILDDKSDFLLSLEWCSSSKRDTLQLITDYYYNSSFNKDEFGKFLMSQLQAIYQKEETELENFVHSLYILWNAIPQDILYEEPFIHLSYIGEPLSCGDVSQTKILCENLLSYYDLKSKNPSNSNKIPLSYYETPIAIPKKHFIFNNLRRIIRKFNFFEKNG